MEIIFNEIVIDKSVFRMVLINFHRCELFQFKKSAFIFVFGFNKGRAKLGIAKLTFLHTLCR